MIKRVKVVYLSIFLMLL